MPLRLFTQEVGISCNLSAVHTRCPAHHPEKYRGNLDRTTRMSEETLVANALRAKERGFRGRYAWHLYSEPTLEFDKIERVQHRISALHPKAKFCLWTNGLLLGTTIALDRCLIFDQVVVSNYAGEDRLSVHQRLAPLRTRVQGGTLDQRMVPGPESRAKCHRYDRELVIDAYGNWRLCCADWEGTAVRMNVHTHGIDAIMDAYEALQSTICADPQPDSVPVLCHTCRSRGRR